jgi:hypothetical protein
MSTARFVFTSLAALALAGSMQPAMANGTAFGNPLAPAPIEGTYRATIQPYVCTTGEPVPNVQFHSLLTFGRGGSLQEAPSQPRFEPGQRVPGLGYWERTGPSSYHAVIEAFILFDSPVYQRGTQRIEQGIEKDDVDHWHSERIVTFFDVAGTVVPPTGCMRAVGERMQ